MQKMNATPAWMLWTGRILSGLVVLLLLFSAAMKLLRTEAAVQGFADFGYSEHLLVGIGIVELACAVIYAFPRTAVLGAILLTGYLGGATATHLRVGDPYWGPIIVGMLVWLGLYFQDERLRFLTPWRTSG